MSSPGRVAYAAAVSLLSAWMVAQVWSSGEGRRSPSAGPEPGSVALGDMRVLLDNQKHRHIMEVLGTGRCGLVVVASVYCGVCERMRHVWAGRLENLVQEAGLAIGSVWLFAQDAVQVAIFHSLGDWRGTQLARLASIDDLDKLDRGAFYLGSLGSILIVQDPTSSSLSCPRMPPTITLHARDLPPVPAER